MRIGSGYDVHKLVENRDLILGGVNIPYEKGLLGHSDADVLLHAITDPTYKGADSKKLLSCVWDLISQKEYCIMNIDATVIAQRPKLKPYIPEMRKNIAEILHIDIDQVNVKATTEEGLGFTGAGEGIAASAVCLLKKTK